MKVLVTGGAGKVGSEVVKALRTRGASVRVLSRNKDAKLAAGVEAAVGNPLDPDSVRMALEGVDRLVVDAAMATDPASPSLS